jgi:uncharacterized membrane protein YccF (DUF307 family)
MDESHPVVGSRESARAVGRCSGAMFFLVFGGVWFLLAGYAWRILNRTIALSIAAAVVVLVVAVFRLQRSGQAAALNAGPEQDRQSSDRRFALVNAVTWISVFLAFQLMPRLGHMELSIPVALAIIGLHSFAMPPLYQHRANLVLGAFLVLWGVVCPLCWHGDPMIGYLALGAGTALWLSAAVAVKTAAELLQSARP